MEVLAVFNRREYSVKNTRWILGFVSCAAVASSVCGWLLARGGGYDAQLVKWHQAAGFGLSAAILISLLLTLLKRPLAYRVSLSVALVLLAIAGHLGGSITHGGDYLTRYAPVQLKALFGRSTGLGAQVASHQPLMERSVFEGVIEPILLEKCSSCHGEEKHKADLRLNTLEGILRGGQDGAVIKVGQAAKSPLIQCLLSPADADGHMPPEGQPQATPEEIAVLIWWINAGAPASEKVVEMQPKPEIQRLVESVTRKSQFAN
jgi:hypothetical protein